MLCAVAIVSEGALSAFAAASDVRMELSTREPSRAGDRAAGARHSASCKGGLWECSYSEGGVGGYSRYTNPTSSLVALFMGLWKSGREDVQP